MHKAASAILSFFLSPFNWIIILIIAGYLVRNPSLKRICKILSLFIFLLFSNEWLLNWYAKKWQPAPANVNTGITYSCGIVPGGFASPDEDENGYFNSASDRFIQALKLYKVGDISHILITGGNGRTSKKNFHEGIWVKGELKAMGVPDSVIFVEDRSNNTSDNARYARQILDSMQLKPPYLLITSAYHEPRAMLLFENAGVPVLAFPCNYSNGRSVKFTVSSLLPQPSVLLGWNIFLKETVGYVLYNFKNKRSQ